MKVPRLKNIQLEAAKARQKITIPQAIKNQSKISRAYKDLELNYEIEYDPDTRSNAEIQSDKLYIERELRPKLKSLFGKDGAEIDAYVNYLQQNQVSLSDFNSIFDELKKMGSKLNATEVIARSSKLLDNLSSNGTTNGTTLGKLSISQMVQFISQAKKIINDEFKEEKLGKEEGDDYMHKLNALDKILSSPKDTASLQDRKEYERVGEQISQIMLNYDEESSVDVLLKTLDDAFQSKSTFVKRGRPKGSKNKPKELVK